YQWRSLPWLGRVRALLDGQPLGLLAGHIHGDARPRPWFLRQAEGGGQILERASHLLDLQRALGGEVAAVQALSGTVELAGHPQGPGDVQAVVALQLAVAGGGLATAQVAWTPSGQPASSGLAVVAADAHLLLELGPQQRLTGSARGQVLDEADETPAIERA